MSEVVSMATVTATHRQSYADELRRARERVASVASSTIPSQWGPIQYVDRGLGTPVFVSHGVLGGHDNVRELVDLWFGPQFRAMVRLASVTSVPPCRRVRRSRTKPTT